MTAQNVALYVLPRLGCAAPPRAAAPASSLPLPQPSAGSSAPAPSFSQCPLNFERSSPDARTVFVGGVWRALRAVSSRGADFAQPTAALLSCLASCVSVVVDELSQLADAASPLWKAIAPPTPPPAAPPPKQALMLCAPAVDIGSFHLSAVATESASDFAELLEEWRVCAETAADAAARLLHTLLALTIVAIDQGCGAGDSLSVTAVLTCCAMLRRAPALSRLVTPGSADASDLAAAYAKAPPPSFSLLELSTRDDSPLGCEVASLLRRAALRLATTAAQRAGGAVAADVWRAMVPLLPLDNASPGATPAPPPPPPDHLVEAEAARVAASRLAAGGDTWSGLACRSGPLSLDGAAQQQPHRHRLQSRARLLARVVAAAAATPAPAPPREVLSSLARVLFWLCASRHTPSNFRDIPTIAGALAAAKHSDARDALGGGEAVPSTFCCIRQVRAVRALAAGVAALAEAHLCDAREAGAAAVEAEAALTRAEEEEKSAV